MYRGRYENRTGAAAPRGRKQSRRRRKLNKYFVTALLVLLVLSIAGGATLAALMIRSGEVKNNFTPGEVSCSVDETFKVTNTGNVPAYIRSAVVVNWMDGEGNIRAIAPVEGRDYKLEIQTGWQKHGMYYYYTDAVAAKATAAQPVCKVTQLTPLPGFDLVTEVVAEAIQSQGDKDSDGTPAYQDAWGVTLYGG